MTNKIIHDSDCSTHNEPNSRNKPCDCSANNRLRIEYELADYVTGQEYKLMMRIVKKLDLLEYTSLIDLDSYAEELLEDQEEY